MRIAYISNSIIPSRTANSIHVMKMCQAFADNGHDVTLYAPDRPETEPGVKNVYKFYDVKANFKIKKIPWKKIKGKAYFYGLSVARVVKKEKPDIIYGRFLLGCLFSGIINKKSKIIFEAHKPIEYDGLIQNILFKRLIKMLSFYRVVVITNFLKTHIINRYKLHEDRVIVAHDGADIPSDKVEHATLAKNNPENINVGYIGQLYAGKGMEIISKLAKKCHWVNFHVIGGLEKDIDFWKKELMGTQNIHFYGFVPHSDTTKYIKSCDVLLAPYQKKVHGYGNNTSNLSQWMSPLKLFEYMSMEKAIMCSDLPVLREVLTDEINSILCNPNDIEEWVEGLRLLSQNEKLRKSIANNAYNDFIEQYTWSSRARTVIDCKK